MLHSRLTTLCLGLVIALMTCQPALACTSVRIKTQEGYVFYARTMEFGAFKSDVSVIPKGTKMQGTLPDGAQKGLKWTAKYGAVGMNVFDVPLLCDGINEKGLVMGSLYIPGYVKYQPYSPLKASSTISQVEFNTWVLTTFASVDEVRKGLGNVRVCQLSTPQTGPTPLHFTLHDPSGDSLVIEFVNGQVKLYDNPIGVMTNAPNFDWMITNLSNYVNLSPDNADGMTIQGVNILPFSQGSGLLGLPGDFTSPSRFVRMVALSQTPQPVKGYAEGLNLAMTIINNSDIPEGAVRQKPTPSQPAPLLDATRWAVAADLGRKVYYFRTYDNKDWRKVDVAKALAGAKSIMTIPANTPPDYTDVTATAKPLQ